MPRQRQLNLAVGFNPRIGGQPTEEIWGCPRKWGVGIPTGREVGNHAASAATEFSRGFQPTDRGGNPRRRFGDAHGNGGWGYPRAAKGNHAASAATEFSRGFQPTDSGGNPRRRFGDAHGNGGWGYPRAAKGNHAASAATEFSRGFQPTDRGGNPRITSPLQLFPVA